MKEIIEYITRDSLFLKQVEEFSKRPVDKNARNKQKRKRRKLRGKK